MLKFWKKKPEVRESGIGNRESEGPLAETDELASASPSSDVRAEMPTDLGAPTAGAAASNPQVPVANADVPMPAADLSIPDSRFLIPGPAPKRTWRERLAGSVFNRDIRTLFARNPKLDDALLDELETVLIGADVGVAASTALVDDLRKRMAKREFGDADALLGALRGDLVALLAPVARPLRIESAEKPFVVLMVGVNGVGKTTTIGKLARHLLAQKHSVVLAAGDTFRAAAVEQLKTWGERNQVPVIADTAGRLHTQAGLMDELSKIRRVLAKLDANAPHEVLLVIDGTTGQNAINQTRQFLSAIGVTGLVVTKLDGTAKGGVVFALAKEFSLPIRFVGLGETADDLRQFEPAAFVDALLPPSIGAGG
jgi:fused signal recognition particle receptor